MKFQLSIALHSLLVIIATSKPLVGLYGVEDHVTILTGETFNSTIHNSSFIWIVEFYASWCGHCIDFAPTFKALAKDVKDWQGVVRIAVVNCPDKKNTDLCRSYNVMGYPAVRAFPPSCNNTFIGEDLNYARTVQDYRYALVTTVEKYLDKVTWTMPEKAKPKFEFVKYQDILDHFKTKTGPYYLAVVFEPGPSVIGKEIVLDMSSCNNITAWRFDSESDEMNVLTEKIGLKLSEFPAVVVFSRGGDVNPIEVTMKRRSFFSYKLLHLPGVGSPKILPKQEIVLPDSKVSGVIDWTTVNRSKVYMADLESGLRYALTVEVPSIKVLEGDVLDALKTFIGTLALLSENMPARRPTKNFLVKLNAWLAGQDRISYTTWLNRMKESEDNIYLPKTDRRWVGCAPSQPNLRGYPCSLWTLFHALTVASYKSKEEDIYIVPRAMKAYITTFFGCQECRENFGKELMTFPYEEILYGQDVIVWLWRVHNHVNTRLHGATSEDPSIQKIQFPSPNDCPDCRGPDGIWQENIILYYLVYRYGAEQVSLEYLEPEQIERPDSPEQAKFQPAARRPERSDVMEDNDDHIGILEVPVKLETVDADFDGGDDAEFEKAKQQPFNKVRYGGHHGLVNELLKDRRKEEPVVLGDHQMHPRDLSMSEMRWHNVQLGFTGLDTSLCVFLWGTSLAAVGLLYCYVQRRKNLMKYCKV